MGITLLVVGLILFILLVVVHELGHFLAARRDGVEVEEFGIFFPPRLWKKRMKGGKHGAYNFSINLLPLGGFVKLKGEHDSDTEPGSYGAASTGTKVKIMLAGVFMNLVTALALFMVLAWVGMPKLVDNQFTVKSDTKTVQSKVLIAYIEPKSPAQKAGLQLRDQVTRIRLSCLPNASCASEAALVRQIHSAKDLHNATAAGAGSKVTVTYVRGGKTATTSVQLRSQSEVQASLKTNNPKGNLGVQPVEFGLQRSTWSAPVVAVGLSAQLTALTYQGLGHALQGLGGIIAGFFTGNHAARSHAQTEASSQVSGPVGIFVILKDGSILGYQFMLMIIAVISLTLAIMNVLPIPALDGGRLFVTIISRLFKKQISPKTEEAIYGTGFAALMLLIVLVTVVDVKRFF